MPELDINSLTLKEIEDIEDTIDLPLSELFSGKKSAKGLRALAWIIERRTNPGFTYEQAGDLPLTAIADLTNPKA